MSFNSVGSVVLPVLVAILCQGCANTEVKEADDRAPLAEPVALDVELSRAVYDASQLWLILDIENPTGKNFCFLADHLSSGGDHPLVYESRPSPDYVYDRVQSRYFVISRSGSYQLMLNYVAPVFDYSISMTGFDCALFAKHADPAYEIGFGDETGPLASFEVFVPATAVIVQ
ncbi:hypothetical protein [Henriciella litoralis]|uniref:hypothetical protein n=1 Tax=Henriciella litoralis TaxID=568102 RepID=UPI00111C5CAA|nr:hypothetical protein [Henriciella litoralis]